MDLRQSIAALSESPKLGEVLSLSARWSLILRDSDFAAECFQLYLEQIEPKDATCGIGLALSLSEQEPDRALETLRKLDSSKALNWSNLDAEELEMVVPKRSAWNVKTHNVDGVGEKKRKRKPRYPKNFDAKNPGPMPDPERWLPKRERKGFLNNKRKGKKTNLARGPQGASEVEKVSKTVVKSTITMEVAAESGPRKGNKGKKKKK